LLWWLGVSHALLFAGELEARWVPYPFLPQPAGAARYQVMFKDTHAFLPARKDIRPNTLHVILHRATLATLVVLRTLALQQGRINA
jgi:hypothetical protein